MTLGIKSQFNTLPIGCALRFIEKQVKDLRCPAAVMQSRPHNVTGKLGRRGRRGSRARRTARLERCIVPARDRKARLFLCRSYAFLLWGARRLFICAFSAVNVSRLALSLRLDKVMGNMDGEIPCD